MSWERSMLALFEDLEQQAQGLALAERDAEVAGLTQAEYAHVTLRSRLHASVDREVRLRLLAGRVLAGRLARVGEDFVVLVAPGGEWVVRTEAVVSATGLSSRAAAEPTWTVVDRLSLRALLRRMCTDATPCTLHHVDDQRLEGRVARVGQDFVELASGEDGASTVHVVPLRAVAALQGHG